MTMGLHSPAYVLNTVRRMADTPYVLICSSGFNYFKKRVTTVRDKSTFFFLNKLKVLKAKISLLIIKS